MRQTKEHKEAYRFSSHEDYQKAMKEAGLPIIPSYIKGGYMPSAIELADIIISEDNTVIITPVSETKSTHMKRIEPKL